MILMEMVIQTLVTVIDGGENASGGGDGGSGVGECGAWGLRTHTS